MNWNPKEPYVPVDSDNNWLSYAARGHSRWELAVPFDDTLQVTGMTVGRSSKIVNLKSTSNGIEYPMFVGDLVDAIKSGIVIELGSITGTFTASKRGQNYGVKVLTTP